MRIVRNALEKDGWKITADPYEINVDDIDFEIDLAAEQLLGAEKEGQKIAVEIEEEVRRQNSEFRINWMGIQTPTKVNTVLTVVI
ncbi:element excision factor XisH family protein [Scytonema sp. PCC 10023]|uniref:element excision factor XisH family protein n=1 Tax=Scytonema sp. PCC 10023 TaxID=1680591 RepID=UPI0039C712C7